MKTRTLHDRLLAALLARNGQVNTGTQVKKHTVVDLPNGSRYYIGKMGGLRKGATKMGSVSVQHSPFYKSLLEEQPA